MERRSILAIAAAVAAGAAVWWSAATLGVVDDHGLRLGWVLPRPGWTLLAGMAAAAAAQWLAPPVSVVALAPLAAPALWPSLPAAWTYAGWGIGLVWAGWAAATLGAVAARAGWQPRAGAACAALAAAAWLGLAAWGVAPQALTGDAPHYLTITQSLLDDGDLDLANNYDERTYGRFYQGSLEPRHTNLSPWGPQYSFHGPGVSVLVLPGFAIGGVAGATASLVLLLALGSGLLWTAALRLTGSRSAAWCAWAALVGGTPYTLHGAAIYPDGPAAVAVTAALWLLVALRAAAPVSLAALAATGLALACLPWLHPRLALPAGVLGLAIAVLLWRQQDRWTRLAWFFMVPIVAATGWVAAAYVMFDTWDPTAAILQRTAPGSWSAGLVGLTGMVADREFGLVPTSPAMIAAPLGLFVLARRDAYLAAATALTALGVWATSSFWVWWGGDAAPARFLTAVLPALALWLGQRWADSGAAGRALLALALAAGTVLTALLTFVDGGSHAYNFPDGRYSIFETLSASVDVAAALPSLAAPAGAVTTELAIAAAWLAALLAIVVVLGRARIRPVAVAPLTAVLALAAIAATCTLAWRLRAVDGWTRGNAAAAIFGALRGPHPVMAAAVGARLGDVTAIGGLLALRTPEPIGRPADAWLYVPSVPAGQYVVRGRGLEPAMGRLTLAIGRDALPIAAWPAGDPPPAFALPVAVHSVRVTGGGGPRADLWLSPVAPPSWLVPSGEARRVVRLGLLDVYAMDDSSYPDDGALWLAGNRSSRVAVAADRTSSLTARFEAGPAAVELTIAAPNLTTSIALAPHARSEVALGRIGPDVPVEVMLSVVGGFPASALGSPRDTRHLGVKLAFDLSSE